MGSEESRGEPGRCLRRRDHEYAARAQMPENMYTRATKNSAPLEYRINTNSTIARSAINWNGCLREKLISLPDQNRQVLTMRKPQVPTSPMKITAIHDA